MLTCSDRLCINLAKLNQCHSTKPAAERRAGFLLSMQHDNKRESSARRGYNGRWQKYRERYLRENPLCVMHQEQGRTVAAEVVDHIVPHKGGHKLFWDPKNHQALCKQCHDRHKQRLEKSGAVIGCGLDGVPIDPSHHWRGGKGG